MKNISILGSTGSIGTQTLDIVRQNPDEFKVVGLSANSNSELLIKQIKEFKPKAASIMDASKKDDILNFSTCQVYAGIEGLNKIAALSEADTVVNSLVGSIGVEPTYNAIRAKKNVALANKETLVAAGSIIMEEARKNNVRIMPIDSEHSAIFQCLNGENLNEVERIIITCSGGPFKNHTLKQLKSVTKEDALRHPTWRMGQKITIDSSTWMNKGFEVIEAHWLYNIPYDRIKVLVHPKSIIHSLVEFQDKSVIAQLGLPDMKVPIQYALSYPKRFKSNSASLDLAKLKTLDFKEPDFERFPCLKFAYEAGGQGGTLPCVMNAANEVAVRSFLDGKIKFPGIARIIRQMMDLHSNIKIPTLKQILDVDGQIKNETKKMIESG